jgi:hypothetical protein
MSFTDGAPSGGTARPRKGFMTIIQGEVRTSPSGESRVFVSDADLGIIGPGATFKLNGLPATMVTADGETIKPGTYCVGQELVDWTYGRKWDITSHSGTRLFTAWHDRRV